MAQADTIQDIIDRLKNIPEVPAIELEIILTDIVTNKIIPIVTAFVAENVEKVQEVKDQTTEKTREIATNILDKKPSTDNLDKLMTGFKQGHFDATAADNLYNVLKNNIIIGPLIAMLLGTIHVVTLAFNHMSVSTEKTRQSVAETIRPYLLDLDTLSKEYHRNIPNRESVIAQLRKMGIDEDKIKIWIRNQTRLMPLELVVNAWFREIITETQFVKKLEEMHFRSGEISTLKEALHLLPNPTDEVRFGVREVYSPALVAALGLRDDMPSEFITSMKKLGYKAEQAEKFWMAHWWPPSTQQAFEMYHRQFIEKDELLKLLRIQDVVPGYREKLTQIAYHPISRVDIRRIYDDGFMTYADVVKAYRDLGYSPEHSELIADWIEQRYGEERKERTKTDVLALYKLGHWSKEKVIEELSAVGYREEIAEEFINRIELVKIEKRKANKIKLWRKGYLNYKYEDSDIRGFMRIFGMKKVEIDDLLLEWEIDRDSKIKNLGLMDIEKLFTRRFMSWNDAQDYLLRLGYDPIDTDRLLRMWGVNIVKGAG